jgi:3-phenylpropionate/trans-cinnamate dioxygenase ferredoxin component
VSDWVNVGKVKDFATEGTHALNVKGTSVCLVQLGGKYFALDDRCTHAEAMLSAGEVEDGEVACPLHGARFDLKTGAAMTPPATMPVRTHGVKVEGDNVLISLSDIPLS